mmetsp:Transcript_124822/g.286007  ORF Transcript_124822/g.286007 Transcript_124822/m.286007 type:complete len:263 (+) Transcript_124822:925-1713(+)
MHEVPHFCLHLHQVSLQHLPLVRVRHLLNLLAALPHEGNYPLSVLHYHLLQGVGLLERSDQGKNGESQAGFSRAHVGEEGHDLRDIRQSVSHNLGNLDGLQGDHPVHKLSHGSALALQSHSEQVVNLLASREHPLLEGAQLLHRVPLGSAQPVIKLLQACQKILIAVFLVLASVHFQLLQHVEYPLHLLHRSEIHGVFGDQAHASEDTLQVVHYSIRSLRNTLDGARHLQHPCPCLVQLHHSSSKLSLDRLATLLDLGLLAD